MFDLAEEALDQIAVFVDRGVEASPTCGCGASRNDGFCAGGGYSIHSPLPIIAFVCQNMTGFQAVKQRFDLRDVVALAAGQDEANGVAERIGGGMDLGAQPPFDRPNA